MNARHTQAKGGRRRVTPALILLGATALAALAVALLPVVLPEAVRQSHWALRAVTSRLFVVCALITLTCMALLSLLTLAMWRMARAPRHRGGEQRPPCRPGKPDPQAGTAMVEFAMVLPIALILVLIMAQSTMLMAGNLCVHYAAYCAARTAIVTVPDGPRRLFLDEAQRSGEEVPNVMNDHYFSAAAGGSEKGGRIWWAAVLGVMPVSGSTPLVGGGDAGSLQRGLDEFFANYGRDTPGWVESLFGQKLRYAQDYTAVTLSPANSGLVYGDNEDLHVEVEHTFYLSIPFASRLFSLFEDGVELSLGDGEYGLVIRADCWLTNEGVQDYVEREPFPRRIR
jgi:hypothetical protein